MNRKHGHHPDYLFLASIFLLVLFGLLMLTSASSSLGKTNFDDSYYYLKHQITRGLLPGLTLFIIMYFLPYHYHKKFAFLGMIMCIILLALVFTNFGVESYEAQRWLKFGSLSFQPAELLKIFFITYLAAWLGSQKAARHQKFYEGFMPLLVVVGIVGGLLVMQPATSIVAVLILSGMAIYFVSGAPLKYIMIMLGIGAVSFTMLIALGGGYRLERILTYFNPTKDTENAGYHINQALTALGSGGLLGVGYGASPIKNTLPARIDDSIFAVVAGELGFVGGGMLVALFGFLVIRILWISRHMRDRFAQLALIGFASIIFLQSFVNMAAISGIVPLTGLPLPFISYGGTALAILLCMSGIIANMSRYTSQ